MDDSNSEDEDANPFRRGNRFPRRAHFHESYNKKTALKTAESDEEDITSDANANGRNDSDNDEKSGEEISDGDDEEDEEEESSDDEPKKKKKKKSTGEFPAKFANTMTTVRGERKKCIEVTDVELRELNENGDLDNYGCKKLQALCVSRGNHKREDGKPSKRLSYNASRDNNNNRVLGNPTARALWNIKAYINDPDTGK